MILNPLTWDFQTWRLFFLISALWNFAGGIPAVLRPEANLEKYYNVKTDDPMTIFLNRTFWIMVLIFGVGYLLIACDPVMFYGIIYMGIIGKILVAVNWYYMRAVGKLNNVGVFGATGDLIFAILFIASLFSPVINPCRI